MELEAPDHEDAPDPKGHSSAAPRKLIAAIIGVLLSLIAATVAFSLRGDDHTKLVTNQKALEASLAKVIEGTGVHDAHLAGLPGRCIPKTQYCGDVLAAAYDVGSTDEVCAAIATIATNRALSSEDVDSCVVLGSVDGHHFLAQAGPAVAGSKGFSLLVAIV